MKKRHIVSIIILVLAALLALGFVFFGKRLLPAQYEILIDKDAEDEANGKTDSSSENTSKRSSGKAGASKNSYNMIYTGDVEISEYVQANYSASGISGVLSDDLLSQFKSADYVAVNNEFCFSTRGVQAPDKQYTFRVNPSYVSLLTDMNVKLATLANNHVLDYGKEALSDTFSTLSEEGIEYTGAGNSLDDACKLVKVKQGDTTYGYLAASRVIPVGSWDVRNSSPGVFTCYDTSRLLQEVKAAKEECDVVVVFVHWGTEHTDVLTDYQSSMAHSIADAGADIIVGSHPHVVQGIEHYKSDAADCMIFYSLGNFIFNRDIARTFALKVTAGGKVDGLDGLSLELIPAKASGAKTRLMNQSEAKNLYQYLNSISGDSYVDVNSGKIVK